MEKRQVILGGGTFEPIRNHLSLAAPAFGTTAVKLHELLPASELFLTRMADRDSELLSNSDVEALVGRLLADMSVGVIVLNIAFCDFRSLPVDEIANGFHAQRLKTANGGLSLELTPTNKVISKIKTLRPDIFLVGFKTTTNEASEGQFQVGANMLKASRCDLVLANDTVTRNNLIINSECRLCFETHVRDLALSELATLIRVRDIQWNAV